MQLPAGETATPAAVTAAPTRRTFRERYRLLRSKWCEEWWSIAFGAPVGNVINALIADIAWVTPNLITCIGFLCKLAGAALLLWRRPGTDVAAVIVLQLNTVCDCMDGSLARYRKASSVLGAYLDKVTDVIGLSAVLLAAGWRVTLDKGGALPLLVASASMMSLLIRYYVYWVVASLQKERGQAKLGTDQRIDFATLGFKQRALLYVKSMVRVFVFSESDLYFWIGLGVLLGRLREALFLIGAALGVWFVGTMVVRLRTVIQLERLPRTR